MAEKDILLKIGVVTDVDKIEALGQTLNSVLGTYEDNVQLLARYNQQLNDVSASIKALNKIQQTHGKLNAAQQAEYAELIKQERELKQGKSDLQIIMKNQEKIMQSENGSMKQQSLILGQLRMLYRNLTDEQKAALPQLKTLIDGLDSSLKQADASIGNFQRNVGNYPGLMSQVVAQIPGLNQVVGAFSSIGSAGSAAMGVAGAFGAAFMGLKQTIDAYNTAISGSAELTYDMRDAMASADAATDVLTRRLQNSSGWFIKTKGAIASVWGWIKREVFLDLETRITTLGEVVSKLASGKIKEALMAFVAVPQALKGEYAASQKEIEELIAKINAKQKELDKLRESSVVRLAEIEAQSAEELLKSRDKEKYSAEERLQAARNYEALIRERTSILKQQAVLERDIAILEGERTDNTHEVNMAIEQAKAKLKQLEAQESQALRTTAEVRGTVSKQIADEIAGAEAATQRAAKTAPKVKSKYADVETFEDYQLLIAEDMEKQTADLMKWLMEEAEKDVPLPQEVLNSAGFKIAKMTREANEWLQNELEAAEAEEILIAPVEDPSKSPLAKALGVTDEQLTTIKSQALQAAQQIYGSIQQAAQEASKRRLDNELKAVETEAEREKAILKAKLDSGVLNEKQYEKKIAEIDKQAEARREEAQKEAFEREKRWNILTAIMNTAMGVTAALKQLPSPKAWIEAALVTATGAAQVATISAQKFARGGELHGASHAQGGIKGNIQGHNIELEGDEVVINKRSAHKYRNLLSYINSDSGWGVDFAGVRGNGGYRPQLKYARGGVLGSYDFSPASVPQASILQKQMERQVEQTEAMIAATNRRIDRLQVQVNISDIEGASNTKRVHINRAKL